MARTPLALLAGSVGIALAALASPALGQEVPATLPTGSAQPPASQAPAPSATTPGPVSTTPQGLRPGASGAAVRSLQRALRRRGIRVPVDGSYGARTRAGVRILQRRLGLTATGVADAALLKRLGVRVRQIASDGPAGGSFDEYPVPEPNDTTPSAAGFIWPTNGIVTSPFGPRWGRTHQGLDIAAPSGRPIRAAKAGTVLWAAAESGYGNLVVLDHGNGETTRYAHMSAFDVAKGDVVTQGQVVGRVGSTGRSTGPHLHFEIRIGGEAANPLTYL